MWSKSLKGLKRSNCYVAYVFRRVLNSRYTKSGLNRLKGQRVNLVHTDRRTDTFAFIYKILYILILSSNLHWYYSNSFLVTFPNHMLRVSLSSVPSASRPSNPSCLNHATNIRRPNVVVEWLTLLIRIQEIRGSNLGPKASCPDGFIVVFLSPSK
jgi:hypothetical protein